MTSPSTARAKSKTVVAEASDEGSSSVAANRLWERKRATTPGRRRADATRRRRISSFLMQDLSLMCIYHDRSSQHPDANAIIPVKAAFRATLAFQLFCR